MLIMALPLFIQGRERWHMAVSERALRRALCSSASRSFSSKGPNTPQPAALTSSAISGFSFSSSSA